MRANCNDELANTPQHFRYSTPHLKGLLVEPQKAFQLLPPDRFLKAVPRKADRRPKDPRPTPVALLVRRRRTCEEIHLRFFAMRAILNPRQAMQYADTEVSLYQNWHRDYTAATGRYREADRFLPVGWKNASPYSYARGNPVLRTDAWGLYDVHGSCDCRGAETFVPQENIHRAIAMACRYLRNPKCQQLLALKGQFGECMRRRCSPDEQGKPPLIKCQKERGGGTDCGEFTVRFLDTPDTIHLYEGGPGCPRHIPNFGIAQTIFHETMHSCGMAKHSREFVEIEETCTGWMGGTD